MGEFLYFFIMAVLVFCAGWGAYRLILSGRFSIYFAFLIGVALIAGFFGLKARGTTGFDAIGYVAFLVVFIAPALAGLLVGGVFGLLKRNTEYRG